jgi:hypothetical protein
MVQRKVIVRGATNQALDELDAADIPDLSATYATDAEVTTAVSDHAAAADPHAVYLKESDFDDVDFLVGTATGHTAAEIVVGTTPGGELGGTWASPTVDATHSGTSHAGVVTTHEAAGDPHPGYRLESADHTHATTGAEGGTVAHGALTGLTAGDPHTQYLLEADANYVDLTDGGATVLHNHTTSRNVSAAGQVISANTVTYLTGSGILIPAAGFVVGQVYRWLIAVNKTAAGTATPVWTFRVGTNQTTADTTYLTITGTAQVGTLTGTLIEIVAYVRTVSATVGIITAGINTGAASFGIGGSAVSGNLTNNADAGKRFGLCVNTGASAAWTVNSVTGELT